MWGGKCSGSTAAELLELVLSNKRVLSNRPRRADGVLIAVINDRSQSSTPPPAARIKGIDDESR